jgi:hypothetical protein
VTAVARRDQRVAWLLGLAVAWSLLLLVLAATVPIASEQSSWSSSSAAPTAAASSAAPALPEPLESASATFSATPRHSLLHEAGGRSLGVVAIPLVGSILVGLLLRDRRRWRQILAWTISIALTLAALVGFVTILVGIVALPTGGLLIGACAARHDQIRAGWRYA